VHIDHLISVEDQASEQVGGASGDGRRPADAWSPEFSLTPPGQRHGSLVPSQPAAPGGNPSLRAGQSVTTHPMTHEALALPDATGLANETTPLSPIQVSDPTAGRSNGHRR